MLFYVNKHFGKDVKDINLEQPFSSEAYFAKEESRKVRIRLTFTCVLHQVTGQNALNLSMESHHFNHFH